MARKSPIIRAMTLHPTQGLGEAILHLQMEIEGNLFNMKHSHPHFLNCNARIKRKDLRLILFVQEMPLDILNLIRIDIIPV